MARVTRETWEDVWGAERPVERTYSNDDRIGRHLRRVRSLEGARVLEVGGGSGRDGEALAGAGAVVYEVDYSRRSLALMKEMARLTPRFYVAGGDAFRLPFADGTFDVVFHQGLLEHFDRPAAAAMIAENLRVLTPGGVLAVDVPQRWHPYTVLKHALMAFDAWFAGWERSFSISELRGVLRAAGAVPVAEYGEWMFPSFAYRVVREVLWRTGRDLPLKPRRVPLLSRIRDALRALLARTPLPRLTGASVGVIARKPY